MNRGFYEPAEDKLSYCLYTRYPIVARALGLVLLHRVYRTKKLAPTR